MPRGVYPRKKKTVVAAPSTPTTKKRPGPKPKARVADPGKLAVQLPSLNERPSVASTCCNAKAETVEQVTEKFCILNANLAALVELSEQLKGYERSEAMLSLLNKEVIETVKTLSALRQDVFGYLVPVQRIEIATSALGTTITPEDAPAPETGVDEEVEAEETVPATQQALPLPVPASNGGLPLPQPPFATPIPAPSNS